MCPRAIFLLLIPNSFTMACINTISRLAMTLLWNLTKSDLPKFYYFMYTKIHDEYLNIRESILWKVFVINNKYYKYNEKYMAYWNINEYHKSIQTFMLSNIVNSKLVSRKTIKILKWFNFQIHFQKFFSSFCRPFESVIWLKRRAHFLTKKSLKWHHLMLNKIARW